MSKRSTIILCTVKTINLSFYLSALSLMIFSDAFCQYFDVRRFGATGVKTQNATIAIQKAIDSCSQIGGGTVYFPAGDYLCSSIYLKDNIHLLIDAGAVIWASNIESDYKEEKSMEETIAGTKATSLLTALNCKNVTISGHGRIEGQPVHTFEPLKEIDPFIAWEQTHARECGVDMRRAYVHPPRVSLIYIRECEDVHLENISVFHSPSWGVHVQWCNRVFISGMYIHSDSIRGVNSDGLDIDGCSNVIVSNCSIFTFDDAICLKSTNTGGKYLPCENIAISNCIVQSASAALKIGTETWGDFRNIQFDNCIVHWSNRAMGIIIRDGGTAENVRFSNIIINATRGRHENWGDAEAFRLVVLKRNNDSKIGKIKNVRIENIIANVQGYSRIEGIDGGWIEDVTIRNIRMYMNPENAPDKRCDDAFKASKVKGLKLQDIDIVWNEKQTEPLWRSAVYLNETQEACIDNFTGRQGLIKSSHPVIRIEKSGNIVIKNSTALPYSNTFIAIENHCEKIFLNNNNVTNALKYYTNKGRTKVVVK